MTDTEVQAQGNQIKAEANQIQERYNSAQINLGEMTLAENSRHNEATESIEGRKLTITEDYNKKSLELQQQKQTFDIQLAQIEQNLKYANEETKRDLERQANTISQQLADVKQQEAANTKWYNEQIASIQEDVQRADQQYKEAMAVIGQMQADNDFLRAQTDSLYKQGQLMISEMEQKRADEQLYWNNFWQSESNALKRDELNSLNAYRGAEMQQKVKDRTASIITGVVGSLVSAVGSVYRGVGTVLAGAMAKNAAQQEWNRLFKD